MQKKYPFKFLESYQREDADMFFGRKAEVDALYEMVFQTDLLLLYGASGTGKTSLIQCGLASRFATHDWMPLFVRRGQDLNTSLENALIAAGGDLQTESDELAWLEEDFSSDTPNTTNSTRTLSPLSRRFRAIYLRHFKSIYLIFDQFEELYILGSRKEQDRFVETVQDILRVEQPVKIIISIREEYLGYLYEFEREVPELLRKKLRVELMNLEKVKSVVQGIASLPQSNVRLAAGEEAAIAEGVFEKIRGEQKTLSIQLPYLQVFLDKLYMRNTGDESRQAEATFSLATLAQVGDIGDVLRDFLDEQVLNIARKRKQAPQQLWSILSPFVTLEGTKAPLSEAQLRHRLAEVAPEHLSQSLQDLVQYRILRYKQETEVYEIMHDSLAKQIHAKRSDDEIALLEVRQLVKSQTALNADAREYFSEKQLEFIAPYRAELNLTEEEITYLQVSEAAVQAEKAGERKKRTLTMSLVAAAFAIMLGLTAWALTQRQESLKNEESATLSYHQAKDAKQQAEAANTKFLAEKNTAEEQRKIAQYNQQLAEDASSTANRERDNAQVALSDLEQKNSVVVDLLLGNAKEDILRLKYKSALEKTHSAASIGVNKAKVGKMLFEFAFWYNEIGKPTRAIRLIDSTIQFLAYKKVLNFKDSMSREELRSTLREINKDDFNYLFTEKYYPTMVSVEGGDFIMGCDSTLNQECEKGEDLHSQELSDFKIAKYEITWWQYYVFRGATGHRIREPVWGFFGDNPVVYVNRFDAIAYCNWISEQMNLDTAYELSNKRGDNRKRYYDVKFDSIANGYQLPSEAQWEYAARGGKHTASYIYSGANSLDGIAWYNENARRRTRSVYAKDKKANELGLYHMTGNAWEWCYDSYASYPYENILDYRGPSQLGIPSDSLLYIARGASWFSGLKTSRIARRNKYPGHRVETNLTFRPVIN